MLNPELNPKYPVYIISKGRSDTMFTSRALSTMQVHHYIAIEPQDEIKYEAALDEFKIREYVTLLILPFSNHGDGPGRARNWCWDHSIHLGAKRHWVMDDNILDFYRLNRNRKIRVSTGSIFRASEDFVDRYENVKIAGLQYMMFCAAKQYYPAYVKNTRIYSCLLIENDCRHRWRGRYNEDTDLSLMVLKDGDCTIQFNAFLQDKLNTQLLKGGNTDEFYAKEGTMNKSQMLVNMHPDVCEIVYRFGRWHHYCDYTRFKVNKLKLKSDIEVPKGTNEYGMKLIHDYEWKPRTSTKSKKSK